MIQPRQRRAGPKWTPPFTQARLLGAEAGTRRPVIGYLHGFFAGTREISSFRIRSFIRTELMQRDEEPLPTQQSGET
jgi:hypothetical protein